jgi:hypothetical protein
MACYRENFTFLPLPLPLPYKWRENEEEDVNNYWMTLNEGGDMEIERENARLHSVEKSRFGRGCGTVVRQTEEWMNAWTKEWMNV